MSELEKWILGIGAMAFAALAGAFWKHVIEDGKERERLARIEEKIFRTEDEVKQLREGRHEFREQITRLFADLREEVRSIARHKDQ